MTLLLLSCFILCLVAIDTVATKATELTLDDVTAIVDQKFQYPIGDDRFRLTYKISKVVERGEKSLPRWLTYNESSSCLTGTPVAEDIGIYSLRLKAMCINPSATFCQERISRTFHINVIEPLKNAAASRAIPDSPPVLQNSIDLLEVAVGRYYEYTIPDNTFNDTEDGTTRQLNLSITLLYGKPLPLGAWLMFNSTSQTLYGIPLKSDMESSDLEINSFILTAFDSKGQSVKDVINLSYKSEINVSHSIEVVFNTSYSEFIEDRTVLISIAQSMAKFYKDDSMEYFTFFNVKNGSVSITWANNTLFSETCLRNEIQDIYDKLIDTNGTFAAEFMTLLANYVPVSANLSFKGVCVLSPTTILPTPNSTKSPLQNTEEKMWIQIILPALIVILLIVIISLILLICCRHRRPNKDISPTHTPKFLEDRRPIIFPEELEMMDPSFKPYKPVILPSDYLVENPPAVPPHGRQAPPTYKPPPMDDDVFEVDDSLFPPPEATTSTSDPPPYRLPPPYFNPHRNV